MRNGNPPAETGPPIEQRRNRCRDLLGVRLRVGPAGTSEPVVREALEPMTGKVELRVLAGQDQAGPKPAGVQGMEDAGRLDASGRVPTTAKIGEARRMIAPKWSDPAPKRLSFRRAHAQAAAEAENCAKSRTAPPVAAESRSA
jgi:hypothetical protein